METDRALEELKEINKLLTEAAVLQEEVGKLTSTAFTRLTNVQISDQIRPFQRANAEKYRGLAIQALARAMAWEETNTTSDMIKRITDQISNISMMIHGGVSNSSEPPVYQGVKTAK